MMSKVVHYSFYHYRGGTQPVRVQEFSCVGSNAYAKEQAAYMYFRTVVDEIELKS